MFMSNCRTLYLCHKNTYLFFTLNGCYLDSTDIKEEVQLSEGGSSKERVSEGSETYTLATRVRSEETVSVYRGS